MFIANVQNGAAAELLWSPRSLRSRNLTDAVTCRLLFETPILTCMVARAQEDDAPSASNGRPLAICMGYPIIPAADDVRLLARISAFPLLVQSPSDHEKLAGEP